MNIDRAMIESVARRFRVDADDLFQEVALRILTGPELRKEEARAVWTYRIAWRVALGFVRRKDQASGTEYLDAIVEDDQNGPVDAAIEAERAEILVDNVRKLSDLDFTVLNEYYCHGKQVKTIAEELDIPVGTVKRRLHVARQHLEENLIERYGPPV